MFEAVYMAATGLTNQQRRMDVIADNVANVNTAGFKASRLDFKDAIYTSATGTVVTPPAVEGMGIYPPGPAYTPGGNLQKGHGVMTAAITHNYAPSSISETGSMLDFAIEGDAFFEVVDNNGNVYYTRAGNFYISNEPDGLVLVDSRGHYVMDDAGGKIIFPNETTSVEVSIEGLITFKNEDTELGTVQFGLYTFSNKTGLNASGNSTYSVTVASGEAVPAGEYRIRQYMLENSNVDMATEMTRLIRTQRALQLASRALRTADDMEGIANNIRR
ncbi:MAG: flagellar hook-basal body protein [Oscillospiraceae bacterium]|nr:flagellar hook-basal body protein [Oscillospiraceae bacterium]